MTSILTVAAALMALFGTAGLFAAPLLRDVRRRGFSLEIARHGLTGGGLALMLGSVCGWLAPELVFDGLLLAVLGTGLGASRRRSDPMA